MSLRSRAALFQGTVKQPFFPTRQHGSETCIGRLPKSTPRLADASRSAVVESSLPWIASIGMEVVAS